MKFFKLAVPLLILFSAALFFACEPEGAAGGSATGSAAGGAASGGATAPPPDPAIVAATTQSTYAKEEDGAPSRASWVDTFRRYPSIDFLENARYVLVWRKDPGTPGPAGDYSPAERYELHQIIFNDPTAMKDPAKFGAAIDPADVKEVKIIAQGPVNQTDNFNRTATETSPNGKAGTLTYKSTVPAAGVIVTVPTDVLPAVTAPNSPTSAASSDDANNINTPIELSITQHTQVGYVAIDNINTTARPAVVAYKVRLFRSKQDLDDQGNTITKDLYNDSTVIFVNWRDGKIAQSAGGGSSGNNPNGGSKDHVPDVITSRAQVNAKLGFSANQYFTPAWESRQVTGTTPLEQLITKTDYEALFPYALQKQNIPALHDQDGTYYTWDNLVKASRYFPKFLSEGTKEDRYRELAAFLGNKSHETGDGWPAMGADRWKMGLVWIVELSALGSAGVTVKTKDDLYKAYARDSYLNEDPEGNYKAVDGKSYHGRGPVQLSHPVNYGQMSDTLFGDKTILLENPDLIARDGVYGWASAIWFWMQPQSQKPSAHDVMVGKVDLTEPYNVPTKSPINNTNWTARRYETTSKGSYADGSLADYGQMQLQVPKGMEVGFGMTINIINGGLESGTLDGRQARRITFYARYLDYFGTVKNGRNDGKNEPISPQVGAPGGDPVDPSVVTLFKGWKNWLYHESNGPAAENFPKADIPNVVSSRYTSSLY